MKRESWIFIGIGVALIVYVVHKNATAQSPQQTVNDGVAADAADVGTGVWDAFKTDLGVLFGL